MRRRYLFLPIITAGLMSLSVHSDETSTPITLSSESLNLVDVVRLTLENSPNLKLQELGVEIAKGQERIATGAFDINTFVRMGSFTDTETIAVISQGKPEDIAGLGPMVDSLPDVISNDFDQQFVKGGVSKGFRTGISTELSLLMVRKDPRQSIPIDPNPIFTENRTTVSFTVKIPLLQGSGYVSAAAEETSARLKREATFLDFQHALSGILLKSVKAYWNYKAKAEYLNTLRRSEKRVQSWLDAAGTVDRSLMGYLEDKKGKVVDGIQDVEESKIALADTMGIPAHKVKELGPPTADFPLDWSSVLAAFEPDKMTEKWVAEAIEKRLDLKATQLRLQAAEVQLAKARRDTLPRLDLELKTGYAGFKAYDGFDNYRDSFNENVRGMDHSVILSLKYPLGNNIKQGVRDLRQAQYHQNLIQTNEQKRHIRLGIGNEVANVYGRLQKVGQMSKTIDSYISSVKGLQKDKSFLQDTIKLLSLMELENKLIEAIGEYFTGLRELANAIAQVRFKTGSMIIAGETSNDVNLQDLTLLPDM